MDLKIIEFEYQGGEENVLLKLSGDMLPITYKLDNDCDWLYINIQHSKIVINVKPTYNFLNRDCLVHIYNSQNNELQLLIKQKGFEGIGLYCEKSVVLYKLYYDTAKYYNFYVTVYGGETQNLVCNELTQYIKQVWDNSDMYNDYIIQVPKELSGNFQIKHSEYDNYKKYCKQNKIKFDESKVLRTIDIVQISSEEAIGEFVIKVGDNIYKTGDKVDVTINNKTTTDIEIVSMEYIHQISRTAYEKVNNTDVDYGEYPYWLNIERENDVIKLKASEKNIGSNRCYKLKLTNRTQPHQFIDINVTQLNNN